MSGFAQLRTTFKPALALRISLNISAVAIGQKEDEFPHVFIILSTVRVTVNNWQRPLKCLSYVRPSSGLPDVCQFSAECGLIISVMQVYGSAAVKCHYCGLCCMVFHRIFETWVTLLNKLRLQDPRAAVKTKNATIK